MFCTSLRYVDVVEGCPSYQKEHIALTISQNTQVIGCVKHRASTLNKCLRACKHDRRCRGFDWDPGMVASGNRCWKLRSRSSRRQKHNGVTHYDIKRTCISTLIVFS